MKNDKLKLEKVAIVAKLHATEASSVVRSLSKWLGDRGIEPVLEASLAARRRGAAGFTLDSLPKDISLVVVLGGDGTLLSVARAMGAKQIPILGVNLGSLGFLTDVALQHLYDTLESILSGEATVDSRMMLRAELLRKEETLASEVVLNDVVITKGAIARIIEVGVEIDRQFVAMVRADGLIVSTPTGSTAYSLAAGGPILHPNLDAMILTPICPHTLTHRPVVVSNEAKVELTLRGNSEEVYVTFDGQSSKPMQPGDVVRVRQSRHQVKLVSPPGKNYFQVLRHKLRWAERPRS
ncbi:MAG TPA: NAD(+)/NADH kinase, partial [Vicinamibacteria bacterium]